jgi:hypothetical protein
VVCERERERESTETLSCHSPKECNEASCASSSLPRHRNPPVSFAQDEGTGAGAGAGAGAEDEEDEEEERVGGPLCRSPSYTSPHTPSTRVSASSSRISCSSPISLSEDGVSEDSRNDTTYSETVSTSMPREADSGARAVARYGRTRLWIMPARRARGQSSARSRMGTGRPNDPSSSSTSISSTGGAVEGTGAAGEKGWAEAEEALGSPAPAPDTGATADTPTSVRVPDCCLLPLSLPLLLLLLRLLPLRRSSRCRDRDREREWRE